MAEALPHSTSTSPPCSPLRASHTLPEVGYTGDSPANLTVNVNVTPPPPPTPPHVSNLFLKPKAVLHPEVPTGILTQLLSPPPPNPTWTLPGL